MVNQIIRRITLIGCLLFSFPFISFAQRIAVLEFSAGVGVSIADVDGLSSIFTTYFHPAGYSLVERSEIDRVINEQNFQRSSISELQMVKIGKILNLSKIVIGKVNVIGAEYNVRIVNVESGTIVATDGSSFPTGSYRNNMKSLAESLSQKLSPSESTLAPNEIPIAILNQLYRKPQPFTVALVNHISKTIYFADASTMDKIQNYPNYKKFLDPVAVMVSAGESAFGVWLSNITLDEVTAEKARKSWGKDVGVNKFLTLPTEEQAVLMWNNKNAINELLNLLYDGIELSSIYWIDRFNVENRDGGPKYWGWAIDFSSLEVPPVKDEYYCTTTHKVRPIVTYEKLRAQYGQ